MSVDNLKELKNIIESNPSDPKAKENYFWTLHKWVKNKLDKNEVSKTISGIKEMSAFQVNSEMGYNSTGWIVYKLLKLISQSNPVNNQNSDSIPILVEVLNKIQIDNTSHLYSSLFWVLNKLADEYSIWFLSFIKHHGLDTFTEEDYQPRRYEGKLFNSLVLSIHLKAAKIIENLEDGKLQSVNWFLPNIENLISKYPNEIWLIYHKAKFLIIKENFAEARKLLFKIAERKASEFWIWYLMGETYQNNEIEKAIPFFAKSILLGKKENMLLGVRLSLAKALLETGHFTEARTELELIKKIREKFKYKITDELKNLLANEYIRKADQINDMKSIYIRYAKEVDDIIAEQYPEEFGVIVNVKDDKGWVFIYFNYQKTARYIVKENENFNVGDHVKIWVSSHKIQNEIKFSALKIEGVTELPENDYVKRVSGEIRIPEGKNFGFIDDVYFHSSIIGEENITNGQKLIAVAIKDYNPVKKEAGWKAICLVAK